MQVMVPDFAGKSITECVRLARESGVNISVSGNAQGVVVSQSPEYGYAVPEEQTTEPGEEETDETSADPTQQTTDENMNMEETDGSDDIEETPEEEPEAKAERITTQAGTIIKLVME
jgi:hypothetical protein